ncbi:hypothetical protein JCM5353_008887 [Sporobolomyces roseus]
MSFSSLPQELVDHLAIFVGETQIKHNSIDVKSLYNLCLVSKQTLASAQAVLYRQPFLSLDYFITRSGPRNAEMVHLIVQSRAQELLVTLEADDDRLGGLIRGTLSIHNWLVRMPQIQATKWYTAVLHACPNLQEVNFEFATVAELEVLLRILHLSPPVTDTSSSQSTRSSATERAQPRCIVFDDTWKSTPQNPLHISHVLATLGRASVPSLNTVRLAYVKWSFTGLSKYTPLFPFPIKHLRIETTSSSLADSIALFPRSASTLKSFRFSNLSSKEALDLTPLAHLETAPLQNLELTFNKYSRYDDLTLSTYTTSSPHLQIHHEDFLSYPLLTSLVLSGTHGPSLLFLSRLAESSPLIHNLDLSNSRWISDSNPLSTVPDEIFPETRVLSALREFKQLVDIHLGLLPMVDGERYEYIVTALKSKGVKVCFDCCVENEQFWDQEAEGDGRR